MLVLWLSLLTLTQGLIDVDNSVDAEYSIAADYEDLTPDGNFVIFTVATEANDPFNRFVRSLKVFDLDQYLQVRMMVYRYILYKY